MISTLAWKEFREHLTVWVALAALAVLLLISLTTIFAPNGAAAAPEPKLHMIALAALILTETYGLICGAMMLAGEKEARTQTFLDSLPVSRTRIWITKMLMGGLFTLAQALVVTGVLVTLGLTEVKTLPAGWQLALPLVGVEAFGYGLFGSVLGRSVLSAFGWAILPLTLSWMVGGEVYWPPTLLAIAVRSVLLLGLLGLAGLTYCRPDFRRSLVGEGELPARASLPGQQGWNPDGDPPSPPRRRGPTGSYSSESWRVLTWLALRQGWGRFLLLALAGWVTGHFIPDSALVTWPMATLLVGVAFGTGMFNGEQAGESYRFLGDQRLPPGQV
ncbi:MAG TPA: hypothetical protein VKU02_17695, partial [Gemmataceae bacterium]|nr:hypothetical protein [Gemmataceae bacterium]